MFHSKKQISQRHGRDKPNRLQYLQQLVQEYTTTHDLGKRMPSPSLEWIHLQGCVFVEAQQQVLANLANFAYDPVNYDWLWEVNVVDLFLGKWPLHACKSIASC